MPSPRPESPSLTRTSRRVAHAVAIAAALLVATPGAALAQAKGGVAALVERGTDLFEDQQYEESIQTLSAALLRPGTPQEQKVEIYRLLAYNYITLKRTDEADGAVRGLLVLDESFKLSVNESPRFRDFFTATREKWEAEGKPGLEEGSAPKAQKPVELKHSSPAQVEPGATIKLTGTVEDPDVRVGGVRLYYRTGSKGKFVTVPATFAMSRYSTQIPGSAASPPFVEYYLEALDENGLPVASRGDIAAPLRVVVPAPEGGVLSSPWFWVPVGVAVVGGVILTAVIASGGSDTTTKGSSKVTINVSE